MTDIDVPRNLTIHDAIAILVVARTGRDKPGAEGFFEGYDCAVEHLRRLADFPWHDREGDQ